MVEFSANTGMTTPLNNINSNVLSENEKRKKNNLPIDTTTMAKVKKQSSIHKYFTMSKNVGFANRVKASKNIALSPDMFMTPMDTPQKPDCLYNFSYSSNQNYAQISSEFLSSNEADYLKKKQSQVQTPAMVGSPIQPTTFREQYYAPKISENDFVSTHRRENETLAMSEKSSVRHIAYKYVNDIDSIIDDESDDDTNGQLNDEEDIVIKCWDSIETSNAESELKGQTNFLKHPIKSSTDNIQKIINQSIAADIGDCNWDEFFTEECNDDCSDDDNHTFYEDSDEVTTNDNINVIATNECNSRSNASTKQTKLYHMAHHASAMLSPGQDSTDNNRTHSSLETNNQKSQMKNIADFKFIAPAKMPFNNTFRPNNMQNTNSFNPPPEKKPKFSFIDVLIKNGKKTDDYDHKSNSFKQVQKLHFME